MYRKEKIMVLENKELMSISGGGFKYGIAAIVGGIITFLIGVVDGYLRPLSCN